MTLPKSLRRRRGAIVVLSAFLLIVLFAMVSFSVDVGYIVAVDTELQRTADAAALAGTARLVDGFEAAKEVAHHYVAANPVAGRAATEQETEVESGSWNPDTQTFSPGIQSANALRVKVNRPSERLFFARVLGKDDFSGDAESIATFQPRDILLVLDYSASMNDDSEFGHIDSLGQDAIEENMEQIYNELGAPVYGTLEFAPQHVTLVGDPPSSPSKPQITVTFKSNSVSVTSTKDLSNVVLEFSGGNRQKFDGLSGTTGTFAGTGSNASKRINKVWVKSGTNDSGEGPGYGERFEDTVANIKAAFNLTSVPYPYPVGSWNEYINYVKSDSAVADAGYRKAYGYMTWVQYLLSTRPMYSETPDLWQTSEQPITALKNAVTLFLAYLQEVETGDRLGLSVYTYSDDWALLESELTEDFQTVEDISRHRQAGHYDHYTNIGAGMEVAREELEDRGRAGALKLMVLMTDGIANRPYSTSYARQLVLTEAQRAADAGIKIVTISLGAAADADLMQQVADITNGAHFNVPGGQTIAEVENDLKEVFRKVADDRPLQIVR
jgi:hypothetical protein